MLFDDVDQFSDDLRNIRTRMKSLFIRSLSSSDNLNELSSSCAEDILCAPQSKSPAVFLLLQSHATNDISSGIQPSQSMLQCLSDSGCFRSCIDAKVVQQLGIPVRSQPGYLILADKSRRPRIGTTVPIQATLLFWGGDSESSRPEPVDILYEFEVLPSACSKGRQAIFGRDLMALVARRLVERGAKPESLFPFATGLSMANILSDESLCLEGESLSITGNLVPVSSINSHSSSADESFDSFESDPLPSDFYDSDELQPHRMEYLNDGTNKEEFDREQAKILADPEIVALLEENSRITSPIHHPDAVVHLSLNDGVDARKLNRLQYPVPQKKLSIIDEKVLDWLHRGKIEKALYSSEQLNINNPLLCVPKKSGGEIIQGTGRVCIDPRLINTHLRCDDQFEIPQIRRQLEKFAESRIFGELDLEEAFLQFRVSPESRHLLCFTWKGVQYRFTCMPFGVKFMTSFCHRVVSSIVREEGLEFCDPFVDNLPFASKTWDEHRQHLIRLLSMCNKYQLKIKASSIKVGFSKMKCLGHIVSAQGVSIDPLKLQTITDWPRPTTGAQMESFLGFTAFVRQHVRHYSELTAPLVDVKHYKAIEWNDLLEQSFQTLKKALVSAPILRFPNFSRPFYIASDASNLGCGGVLYQPDDGCDAVTPTNIVAICAKKWGTSQKRYSAYKKELFGLVYCLRKFHQYIWGRTDTVVYTDHKPLTYMFSQPELPVVLEQWMDLILDYSFAIRHRPGILNVVPDQLSRMFAAQYHNSVWGIPSNIRFEGIASASVDEPLPPDKSLFLPVKSFSLEGERSESSDDQEDRSMVQLRAEMERRGKSIPLPEDRTQLIAQQHQLGHFGRDAIYKKLFDHHNLWWPGMRQQIQEVIGRCDACARFVVTKAGFKPAQFITAPGPWHHVQFDCVTALPESPEGMTVLLVFIDVFSGFVLCYPIPAKEAKFIAEKLWQVCCTFGFPSILQSDNGTEFTNAVVAELNSLMQVDRRFIAPYNPRCDGKVERAIGVIMSVIKKLLQGADQHWPLFVPLAQLAVNNRISSVTQSTPFSLMFARENSVLGPWSSENDSEAASLEQWKTFQMKVNEIIYPSIYNRTLEVKKRMIQAVDKKRRIIPADSFPPGSWVALIDPKKQNKRDAKYTIRYTVVRHDRNGLAVIREALDDGKIIDRKVPFDQLKLLPSPDQKDRALVRESESELPADSMGAEETYQVSRILKHRGKPGNYEYLVLWKDFPVEEATWEPQSSFLDTECIRTYWKAKSDNSALGRK